MNLLDFQALLGGYSQAATFGTRLSFLTFLSSVTCVAVS